MSIFYKEAEKFIARWADDVAKKIASSAEFVGEFWLGEVSQIVK